MIAAFCSTLLCLPWHELAADELGGVTFTIRSTLVQAGSALDQTEFVTVAISNDRAVATLRQQNSPVATRATGVVDETGVPHINSSDVAIACYNTTQGIVGGADRVQGASLLVQIAGNIVSVPIHIAVGVFDSGVRELIIVGGVSGTLAGQSAVGLSINVDGIVMVRGSELLSAKLRETTVLTSTNTPVAQSTCTLTRDTEQTTVRPLQTREPV